MCIRDSFRVIDASDFDDALGSATGLAAILGVRIENKIGSPVVRVDRADPTGSRRVVRFNGNQVLPGLESAVVEEDALDGFVATLGFSVKSRESFGKTLWYVHDGESDLDLPGEYDSRVEALRAAGQSAEDTINGG